MKKYSIILLFMLFFVGLTSCNSKDNDEVIDPNHSQQKNPVEDDNNEENENQNVVDKTENLISNPFISTTGVPLLCAHRGGSISNPENTLKAYKYAVEVCKADILESDVWLTKDEQLVLLHDSTVARTSDAQTYLERTINLTPSDFTLEELKELNFGAKFTDLNGDKPYSKILEGITDKEERKRIIKEHEVSIVTLEELLSYFYDEHKDLLFVIEIKNSGQSGYKAAEIISSLLKKYPDYSKRLVVGTFNNDVLFYLKENYPDILTGAATAAAEEFVKAVLFDAKAPEKYEFDCLQIPVTYTLGGTNVDLTNEELIKAAHDNNISVQYWTINSSKTMKELIEKKCDAIMTDDPKLLREVLDEINN